MVRRAKAIDISVEWGDDRDGSVRESVGANLWDHEVDISTTISMPPRGARKMFGECSFDLKTDMPGLSGTYRSCTHCDAFVETDHYETHLREEHDLRV